MVVEKLPKNAANPNLSSFTYDEQAVHTSRQLPRLFGGSGCHFSQHLQISSPMIVISSEWQDENVIQFTIQEHI